MNWKAPKLSGTRSGVSIQSSLSTSTNIEHALKVYQSLTGNNSLCRDGASLIQHNLILGDKGSCCARMCFL